MTDEREERLRVANGWLCEEVNRQQGRIQALETLVRDMWDGMCGYYHDCRSCDMNVGSYREPECEFQRRMGELGVTP